MPSSVLPFTPAIRPTDPPAPGPRLLPPPAMTPVAGLAGLPESGELADRRLFINRELSLLEFQRRVLEEAQDGRNPLLERIKFLSILGSNLDEFFMVRVGGLKMQVDAGVGDLSIDGQTPAEQLAAVRRVSAGLMTAARDCLIDDLLPKLDRAGIHVMGYDQLQDKQRAAIQEYFHTVIFPVLTPLALDPGRPFPHISNLSLNLAVLVRDQRGQQRFARVKIPNTLPRLLPVKRSSGSVRRDGTVPHHHYFVWLEQVVAANLGALFPGLEVVEAHPFRVTRNADFDLQDLEAEDLVAMIEQHVRQRRFGAVVKMTVEDGTPAHVRNILLENLELDPNDVYTLAGPLGLSGLSTLYGVDRRDLKEAPIWPSVPAALAGRSGEGDPFVALRANDYLLHHPFDSFRPVLDYLNSAATDPDVLAVKQTLYRVGRDSPVVGSLLAAGQQGKQVAVLVELKARFDEESNIGWARALEREGVHVIYGLLGLKTHCKVALVVRKEGDGIRRYVHMATGNYNPVTANQYTDLGVFTCDEDIGADATDLFNYLTGYSAKEDYRKLLVAPINLRARLESLIRGEIEHQRAAEGKVHAAGKEAGGKEAGESKDKAVKEVRTRKGGPGKVPAPVPAGGHIVFQMNSLGDPAMIKLLYEASQAGVQVDLIVRGICCLRPGVPGLSENIRVISIVGRFLEHCRVFYFQNGGAEKVYLGSADLMPRNLDRRVEVLFPVESASLIRRLRHEILAAYLSDNVNARRMLPDGRYERIRPGRGQAAFNCQTWFADRRRDQPR